ncbi:MAG: transketolase [Muribaculaceae bacterium]
MDKELYLKCEIAVNEMRKDALKMALAGKNEGAHLGGGLSMIEIMAVLYIAIMKIDVKKPKMEERDRFILSKGHGVLALYAALKQVGFIRDEELNSFKANQTFLYGHPSMNLNKGIEFSSGSLGQGLSLGVGTCLALKAKKNQTARAFVLLGDGECDEGSVWEAAASAAHYQLNNLVAIIDKNNLQYDGLTEQVLNMNSLTDKFKAFGWNVKEVDGHNIEDLYDALIDYSSKPLVIIANTVKGKGISFMENKREWHHSRLTQKQYDEAMAELEYRNHD